MVDRKELMEGLEHCIHIGICADCKYPTLWLSETCPRCTLLSDIRAAFREDIDEIEMLKATVHNLRLYLTHMKDAAPLQFDLMDDEECGFSGMPGYVEVEE